MKDLRQLTVIGAGLLGASVALAARRSGGGIKTAVYSHRAATRKKAKKLAIADSVYDDVKEAVKNADLVILASPICTFEQIFKEIAPALKNGCIVTDVGSTKVLPHKWAKKRLPKTVHYVGSHPIAGSEQRGADFGRDDLFYNAACIITKENGTNKKALKTLEKFWQSLDSKTFVMSPQKHDQILANVSHLPHALAAALLNASDKEHIKMCGKGFIDTSRIASGPANIWADIFYANAKNLCTAINRAIKELNKIKQAAAAKDRKKLEKILDNARSKREKLIQYKVARKEIIL